MKRNNVKDWANIKQNCAHSLLNNQLNSGCHNVVVERHEGLNVYSFVSILYSTVLEMITLIGLGHIPLAVTG